MDRYLEFSGGSKGKTQWTLSFLCGGKEISYPGAVKAGFVKTSKTYTPFWCKTVHKVLRTSCAVCKVWLSEPVWQLPVFVRLEDGVANDLIELTSPTVPSFYFRAVGKILEDDDLNGVLPERCAAQIQRKSATVSVRDLPKNVLSIKALPSSIEFSVRKIRIRET